MTTAAGGDGLSREKALRGLFLAGLLDVLLTTAAFLLANSGVLLADFLKTTIELIAITLSLGGYPQGQPRWRKKYEYGLGKLENISSLFVGLVMLLSFLIITANAVHSVMAPGHIRGIGLWISIGSQIIYLGINGGLWIRNRRLSKATPSPLMDSQTKLFLTRFIGNAFILLSLGLSMALSRYGWSEYIDPAASMVIALSILSATLESSPAPSTTCSTARSRRSVRWSFSRSWRVTSTTTRSFTGSARAVPGHRSTWRSFSNSIRREKSPRSSGSSTRSGTISSASCREAASRSP